MCDPARAWPRVPRRAHPSPLLRCPGCDPGARRLRGTGAPDNTERRAADPRDHRRPGYRDDSRQPQAGHRRQRVDLRPPGGAGHRARRCGDPEGIPTSYFRPAGDTITNVVAEDGWTIDIEKALGLEPDLILGGAADWNNDNLARYKKAVATYAFEEGWKDTEHVYAQFRELAGNIGRADQAEAAIAGYEAKLTAGKAAVAPQVPKLGRVGVIRLADDGWIGARTAEKGHLTSTILRSLGISEPDWPKAGKDEDCLKLSEETLEIVNVADTLFIEANVRFADHPIPRSALWKRLRPVKDGNVYVFETTWYNSDLLQLGSIVDEIVTAVTTRG